MFDHAVSHLRVRFKHCMGALKGQFQCPQGLYVDIISNSDHVQACRWITIAIILHNMVIDDVEGGNSAGQFGSIVQFSDLSQKFGSYICSYIVSCVPIFWQILSQIYILITIIYHVNYLRAWSLRKQWSIGSGTLI